MDGPASALAENADVKRTFAVTLALTGRQSRL